MSNNHGFGIYVNGTFVVPTNTKSKPSGVFMVRDDGLETSVVIDTRLGSVFANWSSKQLSDWLYQMYLVKGTKHHPEVTVNLEDCMLISNALQIHRKANLRLAGKDPNKTGPMCTGVCTCKKCGMKNEYAATNQPDGTYVCYQCR